MSDNGWTNDDLGFEWLQEMFEKHTVPFFCMLRIDGFSVVLRNLNPGRFSMGRKMRRFLEEGGHCCWNFA